MVKTGISTLLFLIVISYLALNAQISAPGKAAGFKAGYASNPGTDSVFVFNKPVFGSEHLVSLIATSTDSTSGWSFIWSVYDHAGRSWDIVPKADAGISSSIDTISVSSGYRVIMTKGPVSDTFVVWVLFNDFNVEIQNKDEHDEIIFGYYNCNSITILADTSICRMQYPEPGTVNTFMINQNYKVRWKASTEDANLPTGRFIAQVEGPPYEDTWYTLVITDDFNLQRADSIFCPAISSKASITAEYVPLSDTVEYSDKPYKYYYTDDNDLSAPGKYRFDLSESKNSVSYLVKFGDGEELELQTDTDNLVHQYKYPKTYTATLITQSPEPFSCIDSMQVENTVIEFNEAEFAIPNVFTPNSDGHNDVALLWSDESINDAFRSQDVSITQMEITIFNRIGKIVHQYSGNIRDWIGWDGNIKESNRQAPDGVYYYCMTYYYYTPDKDDPRIMLNHKETKTGFIHLYRE